MGIAVIDQATTDLGDLDRVCHVLTGEMGKVASAWRTYPYKISTDHHPSWIRAYLVDEIPEAPGALAYHDVTGDVPYIKLGVNATLDAGETISAVLSHEAFEYLVDPFCQKWAYSNGRRAFVALESCDPVQGYSYDVDGVTVSDWVLPNYFDDGAHTNFDYLGALANPFSIGRHSYLIQAKAGAESQVFGDGEQVDKTSSQGRTYWRLIQAATILA